MPDYPASRVIERRIYWLCGVFALLVLGASAIIGCGSGGGV